MPLIVYGLLLILKILLWVLAFIFLLLMLILFIPLRYDVEFHYDGDARYKFKIHWGLKFLQYISESNHSSYIKILGIPLKKNKKKERAKASSIELSGGDAFSSSEPLKTEQPEKADSKIRQDKPAIDKPSGESCLQKDAAPIKPSAQKPVQKKIKKTRRQKKSKKSFNFKQFLDYPDKWLLADVIYKTLLALYHKTKPRKFFLNMNLGTEDPALTGYIIGLCYMFAGVTGADIQAEGDFENTVFKLSLKTAGRIFIFSLVWLLFQFILTEPIWSIVKGYFKKRKED